MENTELKRKMLNFDLGDALLKKHYPGKDHRNAYRNIRSFMEKNGFEHRQYSGYLSKEPMEYADVVDISGKLYEKFPWFEPCVQKFDVTEVGAILDLAVMLAKPPEQATEKPAKRGKAQKPSIIADLKKNTEAVKTGLERGKEKSPRRKATEHDL